jgi:hypothetical protein
MDRGLRSFLSSRRRNRAAAVPAATGGGVRDERGKTSREKVLQLRRNRGLPCADARRSKYNFLGCTLGRPGSRAQPDD